MSAQGFLATVPGVLEQLQLDHSFVCHWVVTAPKSLRQKVSLVAGNDPSVRLAN